MHLLSVGGYQFLIEPSDLSFFSCASISFTIFRDDPLPEEKAFIRILFTDTLPAFCYPITEGALLLPRMYPELYLKRSLAVDGLQQRDFFLMMHAALLERQKGTYLLLGASGTGKTTLAAKMSGLFRVGSDETNILTRDETGYRAESTPFVSFKESPVVPCPVEGPLKKVFFLRQEFTRPSFSEKVTDRDELWRFLLAGQATPPRSTPGLYARYGTLLSRFADECDGAILHHNLADPPEYLAEVMRNDH